MVRQRFSDDELRALLATPNGRLLDQQIRRAILLERLKASEAREITRFLEKQVFPAFRRRLRSRVQSLSDSPRSLRLLKQTRKYDGLLQLVRQSITEATREARRQASSVSLSAAKLESQFQVRALTGEVQVMGLEARAPSLASIRVAARASTLRGATLPEAFRGLNATTQREIVNAVNVGLLQGDSPAAITRRASSRLPILRQHMQTLVRTAITSHANAARELTFGENSDILQGVRYVATLDDRTTFICGGLDGQIFAINEGPRPPQHMRCRSSTAPVLAALAHLLGLPGAIDPGNLRASQFGPVSAAFTYPRWLKVQPIATQELVLGPTRARLFRSGAVSFDGFTDDFGKKFTIRELEAA